MKPAEIEALCKLVRTYRLDRLQVGDVILEKRTHEFPRPRRRPDAPQRPPGNEEEEMLFYSTTAPPLTRDLASFSANKPPDREGTDGEA